MAEYPMNITVICSICLEGGLIRYKNILSDFSKDDLDFIHEWNRSLKKTINKHEFRQYVDAKYKIMLNLPATTLSRILDKVAVPYRSYHYAKRFLDSYNFVSRKARDQGLVNVVDFGRGLSPWGHIVKNANPNVEMFTFDKPETNVVFQSVSEKMNLAMPHFNEDPKNIVFDRDIFVSLGTLTYLKKEDQFAKIQYASKNFRNLFIEFDKLNSGVPDGNIVKNMGAAYSSGFSYNDIIKAVGKDLYFSIKELKNNRVLIPAVKDAVEMFLVR